MTAASRAPSRKRVTAGCVVAAVLLAGYGIWWLSSARPIGFTGTGGGGPLGLAVMKHPIEASDFQEDPTDAPPSYGWHRGGEVFQSWLFHNSLSVPITITGVVRKPVYRWSFMAGPYLRQPNQGVGEADAPDQSHPAGSVHISAGGNVELDLLWKAIGRCPAVANRGGPGSQEWDSGDSVTLHYQVLPFITQTQTVGIADPSVTSDDGQPAESSFDLAAPRIGQCPAGYPTR